LEGEGIEVFDVVEKVNLGFEGFNSIKFFLKSDFLSFRLKISSILGEKIIFLNLSLFPFLLQHLGLDIANFDRVDEGKGHILQRLEVFLYL